MKMPRDRLQIINGLSKLFPIALLIFLTSGCGVQSGNEFLDIPENIPDEEISSDGPLGEIPDRTLDDIEVRGRPHIDLSLIHI